ncbi:MAG: hypothetical protein EZS28_022935 [Streblomastix strix]|uniref:HNH nuclease domain-containing protein n=1 Tax=Streblomastix strix TaxID=222440 RepID=A0A5J4VG29_9EUKA|nr:MAG: hypothetical protein EZS28_022935 [Streblomastix strix]
MTSSNPNGLEREIERQQEFKRVQELQRLQEWRNIPNFPDYEIMAGEPHPIRRRKDKQEPLIKIEDGYKKIELNNKFYSLDRVIASVFMPKSIPEYCRFIKHKDKDTLNNSVDNLEWVDDIQTNSKPQTQAIDATADGSIVIKIIISKM